MVKATKPALLGADWRSSNFSIDETAMPVSRATLLAVFVGYRLRRNRVSRWPTDVGDRSDFVRLFTNDCRMLMPDVEDIGDAQSEGEAMERTGAKLIINQAAVVKVKGWRAIGEVVQALASAARFPRVLERRLRDASGDELPQKDPMTEVTGPKFREVAQQGVSAPGATGREGVFAERETKSANGVRH